MTSLHPAPAASASADMDVESVHDRVDQRQIFLILRGDMRVVDGIAAVRTRARHRDVMHLLDLRRHGALALAPIRGAGLPPGPTRDRGADSLRKRRRLSEPRTPRAFERFRQSRNLSAQSITLPLELRHLVSQTLHIPLALHAVTPKLLVLLPQPLNRVRFVIRALPHALVMPESRRPYKSDPVINYLFCSTNTRALLLIDERQLQLLGEGLINATVAGTRVDQCVH